MTFCPQDATPLAPAVAETQFDLAVGLSRRYRIVRRLGEGGMGTVFLAEQIAVGNRPVALKVLRRKLLDDPEFLQRFQDEAASTGRIRHPNVVTVFECGQTEDASPYIAMEYLEGETLREALTRRGSLPLDATAEILQQAARGLNAAHKLGIIHRDLKPDNIFLTHDDEGQALVKVVDFGIAKMREATTRTLTGFGMGTTTYMSVEQASGMRSDALDGRSDVYSLGIVVYEMISGRLPFEADTPMAFVAKHLVEPPCPLRQRRPDLKISVEVEAAVMKALKKNPEERYSSAPEFAKEFAKAIESAVQAPVATQIPVQTKTPPAVAVPPAKVRSAVPWKLLSFAVLFLLVVAGVAWYALRPKDATKPAVVVVPKSAPPVTKQSAQEPATPVPAAATPAPETVTPTPTTVPDEAASAPEDPAEQAKKVKAAMALGDLLYGRGEYDDAMAEYQRGLDAVPGDATLQTRMTRAQRAKAAEQKVKQ